MTLEEFRGTLTGQQPPHGISLALAALWWDANGDWTKAHQTAQLDEAPTGAWVHAYLHRKEGDPSNAGYWYARAKKSAASGTLDDEWAKIAEALLLK